MIPINLKLRGMYSYRGEQEIDFTKLTETGLFGIFGPVGSGKSTILEAITYALYGQIERLNDRDGRKDNMMNLASDEMRIEFTFNINSGINKVYRADFSSRRNKKGDVEQIKRSCYLVEDGELIPVEKKEMEKDIAVEYNDFRRTVIIPQGQFREFLELGDKDRTTMLQRIFRLDKYDLTEKTRKLLDKTKSEYEILSNRLDRLVDFTKESADLKKSELSRVEAQSILAGKECDNARLIAEKYNSIEVIFLRTSEAKSRLAMLEPEKNQYIERKAFLNKYKDCRLKFKSSIDAIDTIAKNVSEQETELKLREAELKAIYEKISQLEIKLNAAKTEKELIPSMLIEADDLRNLSLIRKYDLKLAECLDSLEKYEVEKTKLLAEIESTKKLKDNLEEEYGRIVCQIDSLAESRDAAEWFKFKKHYKNAVAGSELLLNNAKIAVINSEKAIRELADGDLNSLAGTNGNDSPGDIKKKIAAAISAAEQDKEEANRLKLELAKKSRIEVFASMLAEGEPCPLCGSTDHPHPAEKSEIDEAERELDGKIAIADNLIKRLKAGEKSFLSLETKFGEANFSFSKVEEEYKRSCDELSEYIKNFKFEKYSIDDDDKATEDAIELAEASKRRSSLDKEKSDAQKTLDLLAGKKEKYDARAKEIENEKIKTESAIKTLSEAIKLINIADFTGIDDKALIGKADAIEKKIVEINTSFERYTKESEELAGQMNKTSGIVHTLNSALESNRSKLSENKVLFENDAKVSGYSPDEIFAVLAHKIEIDGEDRLITDYFEKLAKLETEVHTLEKQLEGRPYDADEHRKAKLDLSTAESNKNELIKQIANIQSEIKAIEEKIEERRGLEKESKKVEARKMNLDTLDGLFRAKGFVEYASTSYLRNLCAIANKRFTKLTNHTLTLELNGSNDFVIKDYLNGGKTRSVKTLSGGQMFQAALCLALALSENIGIFRNSKHNFFFLDEGFGTLDKDSLRVVFNTLKSLNDENRIVGVISHVEELKEEMNRYISVVNDPSKGSIVSMIGE